MTLFSECLSPVKHLTYAIARIPQSSPGCILQLGTLGSGKAQKLAQGHLVGELQSWDLNPRPFGSILFIALFCLSGQVTLEKEMPGRQAADTLVCVNTSNEQYLLVMENS